MAQKATRAVILLFCICMVPLCMDAAEDSGPDPGGDTIALPAPEAKDSVPVEEALLERRSIRTYTDAPLDIADISSLLWAVQGITDSRGYRTAPSAGALYPLEVTIAIGEVVGISPGSYRYLPGQHAIVRINEGDHRRQLAAAAYGQQPPEDAPATIVISGVYARTRTKYGDRAERYTWMEAGHASQNCYLIATARGLGTVAIGAFDEQRVQEIMGLAADEIPLYLMPVGKPA
ncbi:MAG: SagB/ThcOx family dehydrogenase [Methanomicrobiaceae archaeon]|nr:SagB/ThcOx family dehydrogenase [Methanomicrobiaceae archaeon]